MRFTHSRLTALAFLAGLSFVDVGALDGVKAPVSQPMQARESLALRIRRGQSGVEVVVEGVGAQPVLQQRINGEVWEGRLQTQGQPRLANGGQQLSDPRRQPCQGGDQRVGSELQAGGGAGSRAKPCRNR